MQTTVKAILYTSKVLKNGEHPILLRLTRDRKQVKIGLGISCHIDEWDSKPNRPKRKHPLYQEIKRAIDKAEQDAEKVILDLENNDKPYTLESLKVKLGKVQTRETVLSYFDHWVARLRASDRLGYADIFHATKKSLMAYRGDKDFSFSDVNNAFLTRWEEYHLQRGTKPNAFFVYLRTFKTLINYARKEEVVADEYDPYKGINFAKFRRIQTTRRAISKTELQRIKDLDLTDNPAQAQARRYFLFSFYCRGINFVDVAYLRWKDYRDDRIFYSRRKTKENFNVNVLAPAREILDYYRELATSSPSPYIFPILSDFHQTEQQRDHRVQKVLRQTNRSLKELAVLAEVDTPLTTYVARHSFATVLKQSGVPIAQISEMMGHDSEATTRIYLKAFDNDVLDTASQALL
ncbi:tyrosine recombinase [Hymenobacter frigidus]|uniref:Tyrosine recombinase n=1 Tax=Hymenobacter frigidus TaxID=1524095 RepID=A0ABQ2AKM5_9BACT|nr:site-specific integrase [Hymenobacter frigidus]GGH91808.1 tyrosine recombinase [Hymenobacter frigidus]